MAYTFLGIKEAFSCAPVELVWVAVLFLSNKEVQAEFLQILFMNLLAGLWTEKAFTLALVYKFQSFNQEVQLCEKPVSVTNFTGRACLMKDLPGSCCCSVMLCSPMGAWCLTLQQWYLQISNKGVADKLPRQKSWSLKVNSETCSCFCRKIPVYFAQKQIYIWQIFPE